MWPRDDRDDKSHENSILQVCQRNSRDTALTMSKFLRKDVKILPHNLLLQVIPMAADDPLNWGLQKNPVSVDDGIEFI